MSWIHYVRTKNMFKINGLYFYLLSVYLLFYQLTQLKQLYTRVMPVLAYVRKMLTVFWQLSTYWSNTDFMWRWYETRCAFSLFCAAGDDSLVAEMSCGHAVTAESLTGWCRSLLDQVSFCLHFYSFSFQILDSVYCKIENTSNENATLNFKNCHPDLVW